MVDYDDTVMSYATGERPHRLRDDPPPCDWRYEFISVDDHLVEPPTTFAGRLPAKFADHAPRVERRDAIDYWIFEGRPFPLLTTDAHQSWDASQWCVAPVNFDEIRRGTWDIHERVRDMDLAGISASLNFPSTMFGFSGQRFMRFADSDLGLASMRAYNDWIFEEWYSSYPNAYDPLPGHLAARPRAGGRGSAAQCGARLSCGCVHREPREAGATVALQRRVGSVLRRL